MNVTIVPAPLCGDVVIPPSKSAAHRVLICAALSGGECRVTPYCTSNDIIATVECLRALGYHINEDDNGYTVSGKGAATCNTLNFGESGSTARFLLPIAAALGANVDCVGEGRLPLRPMDIMASLLKTHGVDVSSDKLPISISKKLTAGVFKLPGNVSSQYISGIMLAAPLTDGEVVIEPTTMLESVGYIDMTVDVMKKYGVTVLETDSGWEIPETEKYCPVDAVIEGDWSQAAFFMSAAALGGDVRIHGLDFCSRQGDMAALDVFAAFGADITLENDVLHIKKGTLKGVTVNAANVPDMVPAIAATAAFAEGKTVIHSAERLRIKESDRIKTVLAALKSMGVKAEETADGMIIHGGAVHGGIIDGANDHRIVMAFSVAAAFANGESTVIGAEAVNKSYPEFFEALKRMGGIVK